MNYGRGSIIRSGSRLSNDGGDDGLDGNRMGAGVSIELMVVKHAMGGSDPEEVKRVGNGNFAE